MENKNVEVAGSGGAPVNSRWNPTKEQITMLENLYKQGIRTPSAEQIQQITSRLKAHGHIEGKNVFYWFQNHKARQRQKQKQESMVFINHYLYNKSHQPELGSPCPNAICSAYYPPHRDLGLYPQYPKATLSGGFKRRSRAAMLDETKASEPAHSFESNNTLVMPPNAKNHKTRDDERDSKQETLSLFPLFPTGMLDGTVTAMSSLESCSAQNFAKTSPASSRNTGTGIEEGSGNGIKPFFDFFSGHDPSESD